MKNGQEITLHKFDHNAYKLEEVEVEFFQFKPVKENSQEYV